jgi:hypothetical protein
MPTEADTCRTYVLPALYGAGWTDGQIREQVSFTPGRIIVNDGKVRRGKRKRVDYLLSYLRDRPIAVVEAKSEYRLPSDGLQQAKEYAELLDLKFAYSTNGPGIVEHDYTTGLDDELDIYPSPDELWRRDCLARGLRPDDAQLRAPYFHEQGREPRYYQDISIHRATEADVTRWRAALDDQPGLVERLRRERSWRYWTMRELELGFDRGRITIPVRNHRRRLIGLLRYQPWPAGGQRKMRAAVGSRRQLLPHPAAEPSQRIVLVEGEPDMIAARSRRLPAIALPGGCRV